jgi:hypothetical protein
MYSGPDPGPEYILTELTSGGNAAKFSMVPPRRLTGGGYVGCPASRIRTGIGQCVDKGHRSSPQE